MKLMNKLLVGLFVSCLASSVAFSSDKEESEQEFEVKFRALNNSGVSGKAKIKIKNGNILSIKMNVKGFEPNKVHPQHIHGQTDSSIQASCPTASADVDADGVVSVGEGLPFYGPIVLPLVPFDLVNSSGKLKYKAKFTVNPVSLFPLQNRTIVLHGLTVNGQYIASLPVACGVIKRESDDE